MNLTVEGNIKRAGRLDAALRNILRVAAIQYKRTGSGNNKHELLFLERKQALTHWRPNVVVVCSDLFVAIPSPYCLLRCPVRLWNGCSRLYLGDARAHGSARAAVLRIACHSSVCLIVSKYFPNVTINS